MKFNRTGETGNSPSSSLGIMRFFDVEMGGPKISPEFVIIGTAIFVVIILALHFMG